MTAQGNGHERDANTAPTGERDRVQAAYERRARVIAQLHKRRRTANDLSAQHKAIRASIAKDARPQKAETWLFSASAFLLALGCIVAMGCMLAAWQ